MPSVGEILARVLSATALGVAGAAGAVGVVAGFAACSSDRPPAVDEEPRAPAAAGSPGGEQILTRVHSVVDGDTIRVRIDGERVTVRLLGIDTPETGRPDTPVQCYGPEADARAAELLPRGSQVRLAVDPTQDREDRFGRLLAYVFRDGESVSVNQRLVAEGYARAYVVGRPFVLAPAFHRAEATARRQQRGLWRACGAFPRAPPSPPPMGRACPPDRPVKGNLPSGIYHVPGSPSYEETNPERCFATPEEAAQAGFRPPRGA